MTFVIKVEFCLMSKSAKDALHLKMIIKMINEHAAYRKQET